MKKLLLSGGFLFSFCFLGFGQVDTVAVAKKVDSLIQVSRTLSRSYQHQEALKTITIANEIAMQNFGNNHVVYANCQFNLGFVYQNMRKLKDAEPYYVEAKNIRERLLGVENADYAWSLNNLGLLYKDLGHYDLAEPIYLQAISIRKKILGEEHRDYGSSLYNLSNLYLAKQNYGLAEQLLAQAYTIYQKDPELNSDYISRVIRQQAYIYRMTGRYERAVRTYLEICSWIAAEKGKANFDYANELRELAGTYQLMGSFKEVEPLYLEVIGLEQKLLGKENLYYANSLDGLANYYLAIGSYTQAEQYYLLAKSIWEKAPKSDHIVNSTTIGNLAACYRAMGQFEKAKEILLETKQLEEKVWGKMDPRYAKTLTNLARVYTDMGQFEDAEPLLLEAISILEKTIGENHPDYSFALQCLGSLYLSTGRYKSAEPILFKAKIIDEKVFGKQNLNYAGDLLRIAAFYQLQKQNDLAIPYLLESNQINIQALLTASRILSEQELASILKMYIPSFDAHFSFSTNDPDSKNLFTNSFYDNALIQKGFLFNTVSQIRKLTLADSLSTEKYDLLLSQYRQLSRIYATPVVERDSVLLRAVEEESSKLEKDLTRRVAGFDDAQQQVTWQQVQSALKPGQAALEFIRYDYYNPKPTDSVMYAALLLKPGIESPVFIPLFEEKQLQAILASLAGQGSDGLNELYAGKLGQSLYQLLWLPLEPSLRGVKTVCVAPAGLLHRINLSAIPTALTSTETIGKRYELSIVGSTRQLVVKNPPSVSNSLAEAVIFGGIQYEMDSTAIAPASSEQPNNRNRGLTFGEVDSTLRGDTWRYLKYSEKEAVNVQAQLQKAGFQVEMRKGMAATEESFKTIGRDKASPKILHLSTHGFFFPDVKNQARTGSLGLDEPVFKISDNPMIRAGLILAGGNYAWKNGKPLGDREDGILTAYEISQMDLRNTDLVVLSACETGLGQIEGNEGVYGLQRAFKIAGAKHLVMSLWQIPDFHTQELMTAFYNNMMTKKMPVREALSAAQEEMRLKRYEPFYWAGFVLVE